MAGIRCCGALWTGCCFGRDGARNNPHSEALQFPASLHLPLHLDRNHFLARRDRSRSACLPTFFFGGEHFGEESFPFADFCFGTFPYFLHDRQLVDGLVQRFMAPVQNDCSLKRATIWNSGLQSEPVNSREPTKICRIRRPSSGAGKRTWRALKGSAAPVASAGALPPARSYGRRKPIASFNTTE